MIVLYHFLPLKITEQLSQLLRFSGASVFIDAESMKRTEKVRYMGHL